MKNISRFENTIEWKKKKKNKQMLCKTITSNWSRGDELHTEQKMCDRIKTYETKNSNK